MRCLTTLCFSLFTLFSSAQFGRQELHTDSGKVILHFFTAGGISTKEWSDPDGRWGKSLAYGADGREIFVHHTRTIGGHASVHFRYHPNGGINRAEVSDAPDGGIQWYLSTTTFDEQGVRTGFTEQGHGNDGPIPRVTTMVPAAACQRMFVNEVFLVNRTRFAARAKITAKQASPALKDARHTLAPGDTVRLGSYSMGEQFMPPDRHVDLVLEQALLKKPRRPLQARTVVQEVQVGPEHRRWYLVVDAWSRKQAR
jgi:hypothetical protein